MLSGLAARGVEIADAAQHQAISDGVERLQPAFPDLVVSAGAGAIVLTGQIAIEDARLRWIGSLLR